MACKTFKNEGAKRAILLPIAGSFHSPFMEEARIELGKIIVETEFKKPTIPIFQCVDAKSHIDPREIKENLIQHITHPVLWTQMVDNMVDSGVTNFYEVGTDDTLTKMVMRMHPDKDVQTLLDIETYRGEVNNYKTN